jgi:hypothetical protein
MSHKGHLITAVLAKLTDQIKRSSSALVTQILTESAERGDCNAAQFQLTVTLKRDCQKGNYYTVTKNDLSRRYQLLTSTSTAGRMAKVTFAI